MWLRPPLPVDRRGVHPEQPGLRGKVVAAWFDSTLVGHDYAAPAAAPGLGLGGFAEEDWGGPPW